MPSRAVAWRREEDRKEGARFEVVTHSEAETIALGRRLARKLALPCRVELDGELGSGKTTLTKGIVAGLGVAAEEEVTSPTFTLVHEYGSARKVYHVDLYRIEGANDLATLGLEEILAEEGIVVVEWPEKLGEQFPGPSVKIHLELLSGEQRKITVEGLEE